MLVSARCPQYGHSLLFVFSGLTIPAYEHSVGNPSVTFTVLGDPSVATDLIWLVVAKAVLL